MEPVHLFNLIDKQRSWLSIRQSLVAQNVANADTPGFRALDVLPFARVLDRSALELTTSSAMHMRPTQAETFAAAIKPAESWETTHSGNTVSPELEMIKAGEIRSAFTLDTNILRAFHGMWLAATRS
jgi:flagellar basal-body rod protein FlgB